MSPDDREIVLALAEGRVPAGIDPESAQGKHYAAWGAAIKADVAKAPPMTPAQKARAVVLLRGGGDQRDRSTA